MAYRVACTVCILLCSAILFSCATTSQIDEEGSEPADRRILVENDILESIVSDPLLAAQLIAYHNQRKELFLSEELTLFRSSLRNTLSAQFAMHLEQERFQEALAHLRAMQELGYDVTHIASETEVLQMEARAHLAAQNYLPLLFTLYHIENYRSFSEEELSDILSIAHRHNHRTLVSNILDQIDAQYPVLATRQRSRATESATLAEMLEGTVTIWVDKGFVITDGLGHPDRVLGSAFFVDERGYLITNYHVIESEVNPEYEGYSRLYVRLSESGGLRVPAKVIGYNRLLDIALLKTEIDPKYIFALEPRRAQYVSGTRTYTLGSPVGLDQSITAGIISSSTRQFLPIGETLQIDAPVNPGNSGGPLLDNDGALIGVVYAGAPQFQGINFAIPVDWIWQSIPALFSAAHNLHFWIGVSVRIINNRAEVVYVMPNSPAEKLRIKVGDVITHISDVPIRTVAEAQMELALFRTEGLAKVRWLIDRKPETYLIKVEKRPFSPIEEALKIQRLEQLFIPLFGMEIKRIAGGSIFGRRFVVQKVYDSTIADELGFTPSDPLTLLRWRIDKDARVVIAQISARKIKNGFTASGIQIFSTLDMPNFI